MIWIECPWEIAGPASTSNAPKSGASNESSSGVALSENSTRKLSPAVTTIGALALKVTSSALAAEPTKITKHNARVILQKKPFIDCLFLGCPYNGRGGAFSV